MIGVYGVLVHGRIAWSHAAPFEGASNGFFVWKYIMARNADQAVVKAFDQTRRHLKKYNWLDEALGSLDLQCDRVCNVPLRKLIRLRPEGHAFYDD